MGRGDNNRGGIPVDVVKKRLTDAELAALDNRAAEAPDLQEIISEATTPSGAPTSDPSREAIVRGATVAHGSGVADPERAAIIEEATSTGGPRGGEVKMVHTPSYTGPEAPAFPPDPQELARVQAEMSAFDARIGTREEYDAVMRELEAINDRPHAPDEDATFEDPNPVPTGEAEQLGVAREQWLALVRGVKDASDGVVTLNRKGDLILVKGMAYGAVLVALDAYRGILCNHVEAAKKFLKIHPDIFPIPPANR